MEEYRVLGTLTFLDTKRLSYGDPWEGSVYTRQLNITPRKRDLADLMVSFYSNPNLYKERKKVTFPPFTMRCDAVEAKYHNIYKDENFARMDFLFLSEHKAPILDWCAHIFEHARDMKCLKYNSANYLVANNTKDPYDTWSIYVADGNVHTRKMYISMVPPSDAQGEIRDAIYTIKDSLESEDMVTRNYARRHILQLSSDIRNE